MSGRILSLTALRQRIAGVIELDGERYDVQKYTGAQYQQAASFDETTTVLDLYALVRVVAPTLPEDTLRSLDKDMCSAILLLASQGLAAVEQAFPNAGSPEPPTSPG